MQQELIKKKREIIDIFLKKGILISSGLLNEINDDKNISKVFELLKSNQTNDTLVIDLDINKSIIETRAQKTEQKQERQEDKVKILYSYKEEPKKRDPQDFVDYFNNRYKSIEKILKQHQELTNTISINKTTNKKEKERINIIGIVSG